MQLFTPYFIIASGFIQDRVPFFAQASSPVKDAPCDGGGFFALPTWYKYLKSQGEDAECTPVIGGLADIWLILLAIIEILLRIAIIVAIVYVVFGGIKMIISRANPDKIQQARNTLQDALVGLVIAITATAVVSFIAGRF